MAGRTCHSVGFVMMWLIIGVLMCVLVLSTDVLSFDVLLGLFHSQFFFVCFFCIFLYFFFFFFCTFNFATCILIACPTCLGY